MLPGNNVAGLSRRCSGMPDVIAHIVHPETQELLKDRSTIDRLRIMSNSELHCIAESYNRTYLCRTRSNGPQRAIVAITQTAVQAALKDTQATHCRNSPVTFHDGAVSSQGYSGGLLRHNKKQVTVIIIHQRGNLEAQKLKGLFWTYQRDLQPKETDTSQRQTSFSFLASN